MKKILIPILLIIIVVLTYLYLTQTYISLPEKKEKFTTENDLVFINDSAPEKDTSEKILDVVNKVPAGWTTYENDEYGFSISMPSKYKALDTEKDLYGWPNGIVLIYGGGQAYDIAIQVWDTKEKAKKEVEEEDLIFTVNGEFLTIQDITQESENNQIISTFRFN